MVTEPSPLEPCPIREVLDQLSGKWNLLILMILGMKPLRFGQMRRLIPDISQRMLTQTLRDLQRDGLVSRSVLPLTPPGVEYGLTSLGRSFMQPLGAMIGWANENHAAIRGERALFDDQNSAAPGARAATRTTPQSQNR